MTAPKEYRISTVLDFASLTPHQRKRCAVDMLAWADFCDRIQPMVDAGLLKNMPEMIWVDDGNSGASGVEFVDSRNGSILDRVRFDDGVKS